MTEACIANNCGSVEQDFDPRVGLTGIQGVGAEQDIRAKAHLQNQERINGRVAMIGFATTLVVELVSGQSTSHLIFGS